MSLSDHDPNLVFKLDARLPITRGNLKLIATTHVASAYDLAHVGQDAIADLLRDMKYIYPPSPNVWNVFSYYQYGSCLFRGEVLLVRSRISIKLL
jgi:hypothetical protein